LLDDIPHLAKSAAVFRASVRQERLDPQPTQDAPRGLRVVSPVAIELVGPGPRVARFAADRGKLGDQRQKLIDIRFVCAGELHFQRHTLTIDDQMMLAAELPAIGRV
jgi:hypothetical protein